MTQPNLVSAILRLPPTHVEVKRCTEVLAGIALTRRFGEGAYSLTTSVVDGSEPQTLRAQSEVPDLGLIALGVANFGNLQSA